MRTIEVDADGVRAVVLRTGERIETRCVVTAVPPKPLLDALPEAALRHPVFTDAAQLGASPIINVWAFCEGALFRDVPFLGLIGSPIHWLFDRNQIEGRDERSVLLNATISGARGMVDDRPENLTDMFRTEMGRYFPGAQCKIVSAKVIKERRATISHAAGTYQRRPATVSPVRGLYLAGDWVRTGLPATIESACQSGHDAAAAVLERRTPR
jgi:predicted NAD/FAD-dependent oxidoreductase